MLTLSPCFSPLDANMNIAAEICDARILHSRYLGVLDRRKGFRSGRRRSLTPRNTSVDPVVVFVLLNPHNDSCKNRLNALEQC